jgi:hypothetical protein
MYGHFTDGISTNRAPAAPSCSRLTASSFGAPLPVWFTQPTTHELWGRLGLMMLTVIDVYSYHVRHVPQGLWQEHLVQRLSCTRGRLKGT